MADERGNDGKRLMRRHANGRMSIDGRPQWRIPQVDGRRDKPVHGRLFGGSPEWKLAAEGADAFSCEEENNAVSEEAQKGRRRETEERRCAAIQDRRRCLDRAIMANAASEDWRKDEPGRENVAGKWPQNKPESELWQ